MFQVVFSQYDPNNEFRDLSALIGQGKTAPCASAQEAKDAMRRLAQGLYGDLECTVYKTVRQWGDTPGVDDLEYEDVAQAVDHYTL